MNISKYIIFLIATIVWLYILHVTKKAKLPFWHFLWGSAGLFVFVFVGFKDVLTQPMANIVAALAGIIGKMTGVFEPYYKYGIIFVQSAKGSITLKIDFECSGIIEITAFLSLLIFFSVYTKYEKIIIGCVGSMYLILANALRITLICFIIHFKGVDYYYISHALIGRIFFYFLSVMLYFYVFTKAQIIRQKVGGFGYVNNK